MIPVFLIARYAERERLHWWRDHLLTPAGILVVSSWIDSDEPDDSRLTREQAQTIKRRNLRDLRRARIAVYWPSWCPTPGRLMDLGMAILHGIPLVIVARSFTDLPHCDRSCYLRDAVWCAEEASLAAVIKDTLL